MALNQIPVTIIGAEQMKVELARLRSVDRPEVIQAIELKVDGCDEVFDPLRKARGGRTRLRPERVPLRKKWKDD